MQFKSQSQTEYTHRILVKWVVSLLRQDLDSNIGRRLSHTHDFSVAVAVKAGNYRDPRAFVLIVEYCELWLIVYAMMAASPAQLVL